MSLPLYVDKSDPMTGSVLVPNPECTRCELSRDSAHVCVRAAGVPGGTLLVGSRPTLKYARSGIPWASPIERNIFREVFQHDKNKNIAMTYAVRCTGSSDVAVPRCRPYMRHEKARGSYERIICFGNDAATSVTGSAVPTHKLRRAWTRLSDGTLVFMLTEPQWVERNHVRMRWLSEDLKWALEHEPGDVPWGTEYKRVNTEADAAQCARDMAGNRVVFDLETYGRMNWDDYKVVVLAMGVRGDDSSIWVWPEESMVQGDPRLPWLQKAFKDAAKVQGHNFKTEFRGTLLYLGIPLKSSQIDCDTYIWCKQLKADGSAFLGDASHMVGMGGHKLEFEVEKKRCVRALSYMRTRGAAKIASTWEQQERTHPKTGKKQVRKVVTGKRDPTEEERRLAIVAAWTKKRKRKDPDDPTGKQIEYTNSSMLSEGSSTPLLQCNAALGGSGLPITEDWIHAASLPNADHMQFVYGLADRETCERYCARDVLSTMKLADLLEPRIEGHFKALWDSHLGKTPWAVGWIEHWGIKVDRDKVLELEALFDSELKRTLSEIHEVAPGINPGSSPQVAELLFKKLRMVPGKFSRKTGEPSTDKSVLKGLRDNHPVVQHILDYKKVEKLQSSYATGLLPHIRPDSRVHCSFKICGAETGRMSCEDPNTQTIPGHGQYAKRVKSCFVPGGPDRVFLQLDYKTLEMRIAAMLSGDKVMIEIFLKGEDPHRRTAQMVSKMLWGSDFETCGLGYTLDTAGITQTQKDALLFEQKSRRTVCKTVNFGTIFGQSAETLAGQADISVADAKKAQNIVQGRFPQFLAWKNDQISYAKRTGETWTYWNGQRARRRPIPDIGSSDFGDVSHGERQSFNSPIQGSGHEYCLASLVKLVEFIHDDLIDAKLVMPVHDSLLFDVHRDDALELLNVARGIMEGWYTDYGIPLEVDAEFGDSWGDLTAIDFNTVTNETFGANKE